MSGLAGPTDRLYHTRVSARSTGNDPIEGVDPEAPDPQVGGDEDGPGNDKKAEQTVQSATRTRSALSPQVPAALNDQCRCAERS
jgi:hypothetical protein